MLGGAGGRYGAPGAALTRARADNPSELRKLFNVVIDAAPESWQTVRTIALARRRRRWAILKEVLRRMPSARTVMVPFQRFRDAAASGEDGPAIVVSKQVRRRASRRVRGSVR